MTSSAVLISLKELINSVVTRAINTHFAPNKKIEYFYDAVGTKQKKKVTNGAVITTTDYAGNYIYQNNALQMINQPEGYLEPNGLGTYDYGYRLKDHLGNIRLTFVDFDHNGSIALSEITEENNYYPFGLKHQGYNNTISSNANAVAGKFKYNGKELNDELGLNLYDYGARFYDPSLGRWHVVDPLAEVYSSFSSYNYTLNNPIRFVDPDGRWVKGAGLWNNLTKSDERIHAERQSDQANELDEDNKYTVMKQGGKIGIFSSSILSTETNGVLSKYTSFTPVGDDGELGETSGGFISASPATGAVTPLYLADNILIGGALLKPVFFVGGSLLSGISGRFAAKGVQSTALATKYPANAAITGTVERVFLMPGQVIDRFGRLGGKWFSTPGSSYGARSIPSGLSPLWRLLLLSS